MRLPSLLIGAQLQLDADGEGVLACYRQALPLVRPLKLFFILPLPYCSEGITELHRVVKPMSSFLKMTWK